MGPGEIGGSIGKILGLVFNLFIQVMIMKIIALRFFYNGDESKITNNHYIAFVIIASVLYVLIRGALGTLGTF